MVLIIIGISILMLRRTKSSAPTQQDAYATVEEMQEVIARAKVRTSSIDSDGYEVIDKEDVTNNNECENNSLQIEYDHIFTLSEGEGARHTLTTNMESSVNNNTDGPRSDKYDDDWRDQIDSMNDKNTEDKGFVSMNFEDATCYDKQNTEAELITTAMNIAYTSNLTKECESSQMVNEEPSIDIAGGEVCTSTKISVTCCEEIETAYEASSPQVFVEATIDTTSKTSGEKG